MSKDKKMVESITSMDVDFAKWYTDVVKKAELVDYAPVRGCMILRPYGYGIWENIQKVLDGKFKDTGHENVSMPLLIPESLLKKEADHIEGFAPEVAWVTLGGNEELTERLCIRPTSEVLFCDHYSNIIESYKDLPKLYNQWCSVIRWEKTTRPFLRSLEFLWQEGHTMHATAEDAKEETLKILDIYASFCEDYLAIPVIKGKKTDKEKFAGAHATYTIESLMHDGKALQCGTSHNFGDGFAKAFDVTYTDKDGKVKNCFQTSWGITTRLIGAIIMVHGDDNGLVLPPRIAPTQVMVVPVAMHKEGVLEKANELKDRINKFARVKVDQTDKTPGWKFAEYEMKGVPLRLEIGPKDIEKNQCVLVRRDSREKIFISLDDLETEIPRILDEIHTGLFEKAKKAQLDKTSDAKTLEEFNEKLDKQPGFIRAMWCGDVECEDKIKEVASASSRCMPFNDQERISETCACCGKKAKTLVYWGRAY